MPVFECFILLLSDKNGIEGESITNMLIYRYDVQVYVFQAPSSNKEGSCGPSEMEFRMAFQSLSGWLNRL